MTSPESMRERIKISLRRSDLSIVITAAAMATVLVLFGLAAVTIHQAISHNTTRQQLLRQAQIYRGRLLRLQIDEETGIRGYAATGERVFLQPYVAARSRYPGTAASLKHVMTELGLSTTLVTREVATNERWHERIASPLLKRLTPASRRALFLQGKKLVDSSRAADGGLFDALTREEDNADANSAKIVARTSLISLLAGILVAIIFTIAAVRQGRVMVQLDEQRRAYLDEKRIADLLQQAFALKALPAVPSADLHAIYMPAGLEAKVGGDWYDAFEMVDKRILFSIGDVAGHGIEAAVVMNRIRQAILSIGIQERDPGRILSRANEVLLMQDSAMATAVCGFIDLAARTICYSTAGHPPIILAHADGRTESLPIWGPPLGAAENMQYQNFAVDVEPGATLVLYTDGLIEQGRDVAAGERRLLQAVRALKDASTADPAAALMETMLAGEAPRDDVAILTINFHKPSHAGARLEADLTAAAGRPAGEPHDNSLLQTVMPDLLLNRLLAAIRNEGAAK